MLFADSPEPKTPTWPNYDVGLWSALSTAIWILLAVVVAILLRHHLAALLRALTLRIQHGGGLKLFGFELERMDAIRVTGAGMAGSQISVQPGDQSWEDHREKVYGDNRLVFLAHRLFPSEVPGQMYDILIFLVPHQQRGGSLDGIARVEYYFGPGWANSVFTSDDGGKRFAILVSAYGTGFLCTARIHFRTGPAVETWRYIDFEAGPLGSGGTPHAGDSGRPERGDGDKS